VNIDSLRKYHVRAGKIKYEIPNATNLTAQAFSSRASYVCLAAKKASIEIGMAKVTVKTSAWLLFQPSMN
jgi:hypothetical protein